MVICFVAFQYSRERQYRVEALNSQLQVLNKDFAKKVNEGLPPSEVYEEYKDIFQGLRLTLIDLKGNVIYDSKEKGRARHLPNHARRPEVATAMRMGQGYSVKRLSQSSGGEYFYSAMHSGKYIVRSAIRYNVSLLQMLKVNNTFLFVIFLISIIISIIGFITLRLFARLKKSARMAEREHRKALHFQNEKNRVKRQLTNNINHELKTPISSIHGYLELIINNPNLTIEQIKDFVNKSYGQAERLRLLMNDLTLITRMDEASSMIEKEGLRLDSIVAEVLSDTSLSRESAHISITTNLNYPMPIYGNKMLLYSIFRNLMDNAVAYSGARNIKINIDMETDEEYILSFEDNGIGVEEKHRQYIFERFYRVDKGRSRKMGGTGLGLSIVKNAVTFHAGEIKAEEAESGGLRFVFSLKKQS